MEEKQTLSSADSEIEGEKDVSEAEALEAKSADLSEKEAEEMAYFEKLTGRKFSSKKDFEKHYKELSRFVGNQTIAQLREKAEAYDKLQAKINKEADEFLKTEEGKETMKEFEAKVPAMEVQELKIKVDRLELEKSYPEATKFLDILEPIAEKEGTSLKEAYETHLRDLASKVIEAEKAKEQEKSFSVESKGRISSTKSAKISQLIDEVVRTGSDKAKEDLVREYLSEE